jgi:hypothetical protein
VLPSPGNLLLSHHWTPECRVGTHVFHSKCSGFNTSLGPCCRKRFGSIMATETGNGVNYWNIVYVYSASEKGQCPRVARKIKAFITHAWTERSPEMYLRFRSCIKSVPACAFACRVLCVIYTKCILGRSCPQLFSTSRVSVKFVW